MSTMSMGAGRAVFAASLLISASVFAVAPTNPGFEDLPDLDTWTVADIGDYGGGGDVVRGSGEATEGDAYGRVSFFANFAFGETAYGPALVSAVFGAGTGEELSLDWRVVAQGFCSGDLNAGDEAIGRGYLVDAANDLAVATFFEYGPACSTAWDTDTAIVPAHGDYYLLLQVGSYDATGGGVIGAELHVDNIFSSNLPPDCTEAAASPAMLWPPNHKLADISILGVTDPDGDAFEISVDSVFQDEPTNSDDDGDTCPDATGIGTDTTSVRAERVGGAEGNEGNGRVYRINFTATDEFGASCEGHVKVGVPHDRNVPAYDGGPLFDSTACP
jgi:hypothetical protein